MNFESQPKYVPRHAKAEDLTVAEVYGGILPLDTSGEELTDYEMEQIAAHHNLIKNSLSDLTSEKAVFEGEQAGNVAVQVEQVISSENNEMALGESLPRAVETEDDTAGFSKIREFFSRRREQIGRVSAKADSVMQTLFAREVNGFQLTAGEYLRMRNDPSQLILNAKANLTALKTGGAERFTYDTPTQNTYFRELLYRRADAGDIRAARYLRAHDEKYGNHELSTADAAKEVLSVFSGYGAIRYMGSIAIEAKMIGEHYFGDDTKKVEIEKKMDARIEKRRYRRVGGSYDRKKDRNERVANNYLDLVRREDPFKDF